MSAHTNWAERPVSAFPDYQALAKPLVPSNGGMVVRPKRWFVPYLPVTHGNQVKFFSNGGTYCPNLYADLQAAKKSVFLTGLHFMWDFELVRGNKRSRLATVLTDLAKENPGINIYLLIRVSGRHRSHLHRWGQVGQFLQRKENPCAQSRLSQFRGQKREAPHGKVLARYPHAGGRRALLAVDGE